MAIQLQDFAKQVLFGATIEEKLSFPREEIVDTNPGDPLDAPRRLRRPAGLALRQDGVRAGHPAKAKLIDEKERGKLLHFFGNHELLATELMALALLKFPDAPASFRRGLLETLKDEQVHTRIYMHRMRQCGVEFGELPLSDYFWRSVSPMQDPLDYVTRLSLTFEQANLDYARDYSAAFAAAGDATTAGILDRIYRDEIGHVGFGLKWFRRWKAAGKSDWEAYRERLVFPLSPARAKGDCFNAAGRSSVGFDESFIRELQVFSQSRGRTPVVRWFNPDAERYAAQNSSAGFVLGDSAAQDDLAILPAFASREGDLLIMRRLPSREHLLRLQGCGFHLPELMVCDGTEKPPKSPALRRKIDSIRPWAWTPDSVAFFRETFDSVTRPVSVDTLWNEGIRDRYSKGWSAAWGKQLAAESPQADWTAPAEVYGEPARNEVELDALRRRFASQGYGDVVCKAPFGTAAHANRCLRKTEGMTPAIQAWLRQVWEAQGAVVVEPWLERVFDFSVQFEIRNGKIDTIAFTRLINNARGQFRGIITNAFVKGLDGELVRFFMERVERRPRLYRWYEDAVAPRLAQAFREVGFEGPLGIDAFVYRDPSGALRLKTVVEINPRLTMGRVAYELGARCSARSVGYFQILTLAQVRKQGLSGFIEYSDGLAEQHPAVLKREGKPRLASGSVTLNDPHSARRFLAVFHVRESLEALPLATWR